VHAVAKTSRGWIRSVRRWLGRKSDEASLPVQASTPQTPAATAPDPRIGVLLAEWRDIRKSLRAEATRGLAHLTVFIAASGLLLTGFLRQLAVADTATRTIRWLLPGLGIGLAGLFLVLAWGARAHARALERRGLQIETAVQVLLPGIGHVRPLTLLGSLGMEAGEWRYAPLWASTACYAAAALGWAALWVSLALGAWG
jgi:hypothetical protein